MAAEMTKKQVIDAINRRYGSDRTFFGNVSSSLKPKRMSTGSLGLDDVLGGGFVKGRLYQYYGGESSGKSLLALMTTKTTLSRNRGVLWIDAEHTFDPDWAIGMGLNVDDSNLMIYRPETAEEAFDLMERMAKTKDFDLVVLDSIGMLAPAAVKDEEMGKILVAPIAKILPGMLKKLVSVASLTQTTMLFINHLTMQIGQMFGNPETYSGGNKLRHAYSAVFKVSKKTGKNGAVIDPNTKEQIGHICRVKLEKSKISEPLKVVEFPILYLKGIDTKAEVFEAALRRGLIKQQKEGSINWEVVDQNGEVQTVRGEDNMKNFVNSNSELLKFLFSKIKEVELTDTNCFVVDEAKEKEIDEAEVKAELAPEIDDDDSVFDEKPHLIKNSAGEFTEEELSSKDMNELREIGKKKSLKVVGVSKVELIKQILVK